jgi:antitoxin (DNA-binding transcriptional repressor) of toxin-antitoxin stability system
MQILYDARMDNFEPVIDRCAAGETFVLMRDGRALIYMVPYEQYRRLEERANAPTKSE